MLAQAHLPSKALHQTCQINVHTIPAHLVDSQVSTEPEITTASIRQRQRNPALAQRMAHFLIQPTVSHHISQLVNRRGTKQ